MSYYLTINGASVGPMSREQVMSYGVTSDTPVSKDGGEWRALYTYPELMELYSASKSVDSKRVLCGILAILVGTLGIQYFVIGKVSAGLITILLSIVSCGLWGVVTLVQGIMMLCMSDADFERKYVTSTSTLPLF